MERERQRVGEREKETGMKEEMNFKKLTSWSAIYLQSTEGKNSHLVLNFIEWRNWLNEI